jgi:hypothetical protein
MASAATAHLSSSSSALASFRSGASLTCVGQFAHPTAGKRHRMEAQTSVEPLRSLGGKRAKKDGVAASRLQAVGKDGDHGRGDALAPSGLQCEQILNHAGAVRRNGVSAIGNGHTVPHREVEVKGAALGSIASDHACADFGRYVEVVGAPAFSMIGEDELEQRSPIGVAGDGAQLDRRAAFSEVALQRHLDRDGSLFEIIEREASEKCVRREAVVCIMRHRV